MNSLNDPESVNPRDTAMANYYNAKAKAVSPKTMAAKSSPTPIEGDDSEEYQPEQTEKPMIIGPDNKQMVLTNAGTYIKPNEELAHYQKAQNDMVMARSKPELTQALNMRPQVDKARAMLKPYEGNYDAMTPDQVKLLDAEVAKIASGGVTTEAMMHDLSPGTYQSLIQNFNQKASNLPKGAKLGEFIKLRENYLNELADVSNKIINKYGVSAYAANEQGISPPHQAELQSHYPEIFAPYATPQAKNEAPPRKERQNTLKDDGSGALQWLQDPKNKNDPHYQDVLKKLQGGQ